MTDCLPGLITFGDRSSKRPRCQSGLVDGALKHCVLLRNMLLRKDRKSTVQNTDGEGARAQSLVPARVCVFADGM